MSIANAGKLFTTDLLEVINITKIFQLGIASWFGPLVTTPLHAFHEHFQVNTLGPVVLFQAAHTLLLPSPTGAPILAVISSALGSLGRFVSITATPYGTIWRGKKSWILKISVNQLAKLDAAGSNFFSVLEGDLHVVRDHTCCNVRKKYEVHEVVDRKYFR
jgi:NAD(P)-dependent dehydrogenase (short-subunit alcohol dehydrogenase family)